MADEFKRSMLNLEYSLNAEEKRFRRVIGFTVLSLYVLFGFYFAARKISVEECARLRDDPAYVIEVRHELETSPLKFMKKIFVYRDCKEELE